MKYLILIALVTACSPKDFRVRGCLKKSLGVCRTGIWPLTKEECTSLLKEKHRMNPTIIFSCKRVKK